MLTQRDAVVDDAPALHHILTEVSKFGGQWTLEQVQSELAVGRGLLLEESAQRVAAFVLFRTVGEEIEITNLATSSGFQRLGLMRRILANFLSQIPSTSRVWLEVHEGNIAAKGLYETLGFQLAGTRPRYYRDGAACCLYRWERQGPGGLIG